MKFYVVWRGRVPGIYDSWKACEAQVKGFSGAAFKAFPTREMAEAAFSGDYEDYKGKPASAKQWLFAPTPPRLPSLCVDAACSGSPGPVEYRGVDTESGKEYFRRGPFAEGTNNVGEFLAIVHALAWVEKHAPGTPIYSDSETALAWVRAGHCKTTLAKTDANAPLFERIFRAELWLREHPRALEETPMLKWDTRAWGEIPADFGRK